MKLVSSYDRILVGYSLSEKNQDVIIVLYSIKDSVTETMSCKGLLLDKLGWWISIFSIVKKNKCDCHLCEKHREIIVQKCERHLCEKHREVVHNSPATWCSLHQ
jgi:hypothetical protein